MKQVRYGRKVINWHRNEVSSRRKRQVKSDRLSAKELTYARREITSLEDIVKDENYYELFLDNFFSECPCCPSWDGQENQAAWVNNEFLNNIFFNNTIGNHADWRKLNDVFQNTESVKPKNTPDIYEYFCFLNSPNRFKNDLSFKFIQKSIGSGRKKIMEVENARKLFGFSQRVCLFAPFWVRSPESWDPNGSTDLIKHLFEIYPVPDFLRNCWYQNSDQKWLLWHIMMSQGMSLKKYSKKFGWEINNKLQASLLGIVGKINPKDALFRAQILSMNGTKKDIERLSIHDYLKYDCSEKMDPHFKRFWIGTIEWFIRNRDLIMDHECRLILEWAMHKYTESERAGSQEFTWKKRTVNSVVSASREYNKSSEMPILNRVWNKYGFEKNYILNDDNWEFIELNSSNKLFVESKEMHHCVNSYVDKCVSGKTAIVSVSKNGFKEVTLEVSLPGHVVVQAKKSYNRMPSEEDHNIIDIWKNEILNNAGI